MSSIPNRYDQWLKRESDRRQIERAFDALDRQADQLADTTNFGSALKLYVEGICGVILRWPQS